MSAPKGNKYAIGNTGGRPRIYDDPDELAREVDAYFVYCEGESHEEEITIKDPKTQKNKKVKTLVWDREPEAHTITGLCLYLGFGSRSTLDDYEKRGEEFSYIIRKAKMRVEHRYEKGLQGVTPTGAIFALKNMGWKDKTESDQNVNMGITWKEEKTYPNASEPETN